MTGAIPPLSGATWTEDPENPILYPPPLSPVLADPSFICPEDAPDGRWHLFAHSIHGIHQYVSEDGRKFHGGAITARNGMRPFVLRHGDLFYLYYERFRSMGLYTSWLPVEWYSRIVVSRSADLKRWSPPREILSPSLPWHDSGKYGKSVGLPCFADRA